MVSNPAAPATKQDVALIMESISGLYQAIANFRIETEQWKVEMQRQSEEWKDEIIRHFDVVTENLDRDLRGAFRDHTSVNTNRFAGHDKRITRLERHTGLVSR